MQQLRKAPGQGGFTLLEMMVALVILGIVLAVGVPRMSAWVTASQAKAASQFYAEGFALARAQALTHNSASRLVLTDNAANGKLNWQVDICFPRPETACSNSSGAWSTTTAAAARDPEGTAGFKSVLRSADSIPGNGVLTLAVTPTAARSVYFTPVGWVDTNVATRVARIDMTPAAGRAADFPAARVVLTLAGIAIKCDPAAADGNPRRCPPL